MLHKIIAVSSSSFDQWGCIQCGSDSVYNSRGVSGVATVPAKCKECDTEFVLLSHGLTKSNLGFGHPAVYPKLHKHPRIGIPKHQYLKPDVVPEEYDLAGFVKSQLVREQFLKMFSEIIVEGENKNGTYCFVFGKKTIWLDYRKSEPNWMQLKIGYYSEYMKNIDSLSLLTTNIITTKKKYI